MKMQWLLIVFLSWPLVAQDGGGTANLLKNADFEQKFTANGVASGWSDNSSWAPVKVTYSPETGHAGSGKQAQKIECTEIKGGAVQFVQGQIKVEKGKIYEFSAMLRGDCESPVSLLLRQSKAPYGNYMSKGFQLTNEWHRYTFKGQVSKSDDSCYLMIHFAGKGTVWVDDVVFKEAVDAAMTYDNAGKNLLENSSFELGLVNWGAKVRENGGYRYYAEIEAKDICPEIDGNTAVHGKNSLKIALPDHAAAMFTSKYYAANSGRKHTLSLWLKSEPAGRQVSIAIGNGYTGQGEDIAKTVTVSSAWQRYELNVTDLPVAADDMYFVRLRTTGKGTLWLDAVQFEEGAMTDYHPASPVETALVADHADGLYRLGEKPSFTLRACNYGNTPVTINAALAAVDIFDKNVANGEMTVSVPAQSVTGNTVQLSLPNGGFNVRATAGRGSPFAPSEALINIIPAPVKITPEQSAFGNHFRLNDRSCGMAAATGHKWLRLHPPMITKWMIAEPVKGEWYWFDEQVALAEKHGIAVFGSLDTTPLWASSHPEKGNGWVGSATGYPARDLKEWENYVGKMVGHYRTIKYWEVWNEPDGSFFNAASGNNKDKAKEYVQLLKSAYKAAKAANPDCVIVGGVGCHLPPVLWLRQIFAEGALDYCDVLSVHIYPIGVISPEEQYAEYAGEIRAEMKKYGKEKPLWHGEYGVGMAETAYKLLHEVMPEYAAKPPESASYMVKSAVCNLAAGFERFFFYSMFNAGQIDRRECTGMLEWDGAPRPALAAWAVCASMIDGLTFQRQYIPAAGVKAYVFTGRGKTVTVFWLSKNGTPVTVDLESSENASYYDMMGNPVSGKIKAVSAPQYMITQ